MLTGVRRHLAATALALAPMVVVGGWLWLDDRVEHAWDGEWLMVSGEHEGVPITPVTFSELTLTFDGSHVDAMNGCGHLAWVGHHGWFSASLDDPADFWPDPDGTMGACTSPERARVATIYVRAVSAVTDADLDDDALTLTGPTTRLVFERMPGRP